MVASINIKHKLFVRLQIFNLFTKQINGMSESHLLMKSTHDVNKLYMDFGDYCYASPHVYTRARGSTLSGPSYPRGRSSRLLNQAIDPRKVLEPPPRSFPHEWRGRQISPRPVSFVEAEALSRRALEESKAPASDDDLHKEDPGLVCENFLKWSMGHL